MGSLSMPPAVPEEAPSSRRQNGCHAPDGLPLRLDHTESKTQRAERLAKYERERKAAQRNELDRVTARAARIFDAMVERYGADALCERVGVDSGALSKMRNASEEGRVAQFRLVVAMLEDDGAAVVGIGLQSEDAGFMPPRRQRKVTRVQVDAAFAAELATVDLRAVLVPRVARRLGVSEEQVRSTIHDAGHGEEAA